jgi:hypothetical protein
MKLICSLTPRSDGTVVLHMGATAIVFSRGSSIDLEGDVPDDIVLEALATGNFYPATEDDEALALKMQVARDKSDGVDADGELPHDPDAPPVEGATAKRGRKAKE